MLHVRISGGPGEKSLGATRAPASMHPITRFQVDSTFVNATRPRSRSYLPGKTCRKGSPVLS